MTAIAIRFKDSDAPIEKFASMIKENSEKQVAKVMFNVEVYPVGSNILFINKDFVPRQVLNMIYLFLLVGSALAWLIWDVHLPFFIVAGFMLFWSVLNTPSFNFFMFKLMIRRSGYKGRVVML